MRKPPNRNVAVSGVAAAMLVLSAAAVQAQTNRQTGPLELAVQLGFGGHLGESPSPQAGAGAIELGYRSNTWAFLVRAEILGLTQACAAGLGGCRYPSAELLGFSAGVRKSIPVSDRFVPYVGATGGLHLWTEGSFDPGTAFDLGFAVPTGNRVSFELGARLRTVWRDSSFSVLTGQFGTRIAF